jgi:hypothetical protein
MSIANKITKHFSSPRYGQNIILVGGHLREISVHLVSMVITIRFWEDIDKVDVLVRRPNESRIGYTCDNLFQGIRLMHRIIDCEEL